MTSKTADKDAAGEGEAVANYRRAMEELYGDRFDPEAVDRYAAFRDEKLRIYGRKPLWPDWPKWDAAPWRT